MSDSLQKLKKKIWRISEHEQIQTRGAVRPESPSGGLGLQASPKLFHPTRPSPPVLKNNMSTTAKQILFSDITDTKIQKNRSMNFEPKKT